MAIKYYYSEHGEPKGPFMKHELIGKPITGETLVWMEGMATWQPASEVAMLADILDGSFASTQNLPPAMPGTTERPARPEPPVQSGMGTETIIPPTPEQEINMETESKYAPQSELPDSPGPQFNSTAYTNSQRTAYRSPNQSGAQSAYGTQQPTMTPPDANTFLGVREMRMPSNQFGWTLTGTVLSGLAVLTIFGGFFPSLIFCIPLILGIMGISKGSSIQGLWLARRYENAYMASRQAKTLGIWSIVTFAAINFIGLIMLIAGIGFLAALANTESI